MRYSWGLALPLLLLAMGLGACSDDDNQNPVCGNGVVEEGEQCDGANHDGQTCLTLGMDGGNLACTSTCTFDRSGCEGCGNGTLEIGEECDASDFGTQTCANSGFQSGDLTCNTDCTIDVSSCVGGCGNGVVEGDEECDPPDGDACGEDCFFAGSNQCDEPDEYDTDCAEATTGQWCWDGGDGGILFCGCDPEYGDSDCQIEGYERCNPDTLRCEPPPDCGGDSNEDNDTEATATSLSSGVDNAGATCAYDPDWFVFTAGSNAAEILVTWTDDGETDLDAYVTDCATTILAQGESTASDQELLTVTDLEAGTDYCILVNHYSGGDDINNVDYSITYWNRTGCTLDSDCTGGEYCPFAGATAGICQSGTPSGAGCGDAVSGDNDTSSRAETLTSGVAITEDSCDGHPDGPVDIDWFSITVATGESVSLIVNETTFNAALGDLDFTLLDSNGDYWVARATTSNPETLSATGLPAGTYYVVVEYYDNDSSVAGATTYNITFTATAGSGCTSRQDCAQFYQRGECQSGECVPFEGAAGQGPGDYCDDSADCDPSTTGSTYTSSLCFTGDSLLAADNVCVIDCTQDSDCTPYGMHCLIVDDTNTPPGICLAPCTSDAGCGGYTCNTSTGVCE